MDEIIRIPDIDKYDQKIVDGTLLLTPKKIYIEEFELFQLSLRYSKILQCCIRGEDRIITEKNSLVLSKIYLLKLEYKLIPKKYF